MFKTVFKNRTANSYNAAVSLVVVFRWIANFCSTGCLPVISSKRCS